MLVWHFWDTSQNEKPTNPLKGFYCYRLDNWILATKGYSSWISFFTTVWSHISIAGFISHNGSWIGFFSPPLWFTQENCLNADVVEQIYKRNPILRYTHHPLHSPLLPLPYGDINLNCECFRLVNSSSLPCCYFLYPGECNFSSYQKMCKGRDRTGWGS